ncbi:MAG: hypothetical protein JSV73_03760 [Flavobacteriaceae bacterium]|nr:MAG: hypothetical protein JSV73_03760 [Flavobacteriaceae bacterium]
MKNLIIFAFLILTFGCSDDDTFPPVDGNAITETSPLSISISTVDDFDSTSCSDFGDSSFLMKDNSIVRGAIGKFGRLDDSADNHINIYSCSGNDKFAIQRFGGIFTTTDGKEFVLQGFLEIHRDTQEVQGSITIDSMYDKEMPDQYAVAGIIKKSGSCNLTGRSIG